MTAAFSSQLSLCEPQIWTNWLKFSNHRHIPLSGEAEWVIEHRNFILLHFAYWWSTGPTHTRPVLRSRLLFFPFYQCWAFRPGLTQRAAAPFIFNNFTVICYLHKAQHISKEIEDMALELCFVNTFSKACPWCIIYGQLLTNVSKQETVNLQWKCNAA